MNEADTKQAGIFKKYLEQIEKLAKEGQARGGRASKMKSRSLSAVENRAAQPRAGGKSKGGEKNRSPHLRKAA